MEITTNIGRHAQVELDLLSKSAPDPNNRPLVEEFKDEIIALCEKFGKSGQSGGSYKYTARALSMAVETLCCFETIVPLTGLDEEWSDITNTMNDGEPMWQNKRESGLFKYADGSVHYVDAIVKRTQNGTTWSGSFWLSKEDYLQGNKERKIGNTQKIKNFPFKPKTFFIDVIEEEVAKDDWEMYVIDPKQLEEVWEYYEKPDFLK